MNKNHHFDGLIKLTGVIMEEQAYITPEYTTAEEIKKVRKQLGLTQKEFALLINSSKATVERWERSAGEITGIADATAVIAEGITGVSANSELVAAAYSRVIFKDHCRSAVVLFGYHFITLQHILYKTIKYKVDRMGNYIQLSLETHLFFARIMKEHSLFLEAGFQCKEKGWIRRADMFRQQFENLHRDVVMISDERVGREILGSDELVTKYTLPAERRTEQLSGVGIDSRITIMQQNMNSGSKGSESREVMMAVSRINQRALKLLDGLIAFKEELLQQMSNSNVYNANYPLLVKHIIREAKLYREMVCELVEKQDISQRDLRETEEFWNRIMMEHALFIRGLLDPSECELIDNADAYAAEYRELLKMAGEQECKAGKMWEESLGTTLRFSDFKGAGTEGILESSIASIIMPLLADHVLREANHYIRLLRMAEGDMCDEEESCSQEVSCEKARGNTCNCRH